MLKDFCFLVSTEKYRTFPLNTDLPTCEIMTVLCEVCKDLAKFAFSGVL